MISFQNFSRQMSLGSIATLTALFACSEAKQDTGSSTKSLNEVQAIVKRNDGRFDVICSDGRYEIRRADEISKDRACSNIFDSIEDLTPSFGEIKIGEKTAEIRLRYDVLIGNYPLAKECSQFFVKDDNQNWLLKTGCFSSVVKTSTAPLAPRIAFEVDSRTLDLNPARWFLPVVNIATATSFSSQSYMTNQNHPAEIENLGAFIREGSGNWIGFSDVFEIKVGGTNVQPVKVTFKESAEPDRKMLIKSVEAIEGAKSLVLGELSISNETLAKISFAKSATSSLIQPICEGVCQFTLDAESSLDYMGQWLEKLGGSNYRAERSIGVGGLFRAAKGTKISGHWESAEFNENRGRYGMPIRYVRKSFFNANEFTLAHSINFTFIENWDSSVRRFSVPAGSRVSVAKTSIDGLTISVVSESSITPCAPNQKVTFKLTKRSSDGSGLWSGLYLEKDSPICSAF